MYFSLQLMNGVIKEIYCKKNSFMNNFEILHFFFCYYHCVKSVRIRNFLGPYSIRMRENMDQINSNTDTFHAVYRVLSSKKIGFYIILCQKMPKNEGVFMLFSKVMIFYCFSNIQLCFFQCITAIHHCYINMYHIFRKREMILRQIIQFIGYLIFTGKCTVRLYKELCSYVKL